MKSQNETLTSFQQNLATLSLLLAGDHAAAADALKSGSVRAQGFAEFVRKHNLQLFVFSLLNGSPVRKLLPSAWLQELKWLCVRQWAKQETLLRELTQLSTALWAAGHEFILLKGPYLATRFCGGIEHRAFSDLDILIRLEQLPAIDNLLHRCGYVRKSSIIVNRTLTAHFTHAFDFAKSDVTVDLHWLLSANAAHYLDYDALWRQRQTFVLQKEVYSVLSDEYEVVFSLISIFKDMERGAARLKSFVDLYFILKQLSCRMDWQAFLEHRRREKIVGIAINILHLFLEFFDCRSRFPELSSIVARENRWVKVIPREYQQSLIEAPRAALKNKVWAAGMYECSRIHVLLWWLASLPFRLAVYDPRKYARFKNRLQQGINRLRSRTLAGHSRERL